MLELFSICYIKITIEKYALRRTMKALIDLMYQKLQDVTNRIELLKQQFDSFSPILNDDENLSSLVVRLQQDVADFKIKLVNYESDINSLNNTYSICHQPPALRQVHRDKYAYEYHLQDEWISYKLRLHISTRTSH